MSDRERTVLSGVPVDLSKYPRELPPYVVKPGYASAPCQECGDPLWIGPIQQKLRAEGWELICMLCLAKQGLLDNEYNVIDVSDLP